MQTQGFGLRAEMEGEEVARLQLALSELGHVIVVDEAERRRFGASTTEALRSFQSQAGLAATGVCEEESWRLLEVALEAERCGPQPAELLVQGRVRDGAGRPVAGATVTAVDKDLRHEQELRSAQTDEQGLYCLSYTHAQFRRAEKARADLIVRAYQAGRLLAESPVIFNAPRVALVNLIPGELPYRGPSEYEKLVAAATPVLDAIPPADLRPSDIAFLHGELNLDADHLRFFATAARLARDTEVPAAAFYGMFRTGLSTELAALLSLKPEARKSALQRALADNLIPLAIGAQIDAIESKMAKAVVNQAYREPPAGAGPSVGAVLATSAVPRAAQEAFLGAYTARTAGLPRLWADLAANPSVGPAHVADLQFTFQATALARNHLPMVQALQQVRKDGKTTTLRDLAQLDDSDWRLLVQKSGVPPDVPGADDAEKAARYARALSATVARAFPAAVLAARIDREADPKNGDLRTFFAKNPDFELAEGHVDVYLENHPDALVGTTNPAAVQTRLKQLRRVFNLTPEHAEIKLLLDDKLDSAQAVVKIGREAFISRYITGLGSDRAADVFDRAQQIAATALLLFGRFSPRLNSVGPIVTTRIGG